MIERTLKVVVNGEEQYSIWPREKPNPEGWADAGYEGGEEECLTWIERVWTDMRPLSLRRALADRGKDRT